MKQFAVLVFLFSLIYSQSSIIYTQENPQAYAQFLKDRTTSEILSLSGTDWKYQLKDDEPWQSISIPSSFNKPQKIKFRKKIYIPENFRSQTNVFHLLGIENNAIVRINGEVVASYHYNGAPYKFTIDNDKLYFGQENVVEINTDNLLDFTTTFPRRIITTQPHVFGGISKELFIESIPVADIEALAFNRETFDVSFTLSALEADSIRYYNVQTTATLLTLDLDTIVSSPSYFVGRRQNSNVFSWDIKKFLGRNNTDRIQQPFYLSIDVVLLQNKNELRLKRSITFIPFKAEEKPLRIISKIEQSESNGNQYTLHQIESDVTKIREAGFNAIYFPYQSPHPYYHFLAKKYGFKIIVGIPTYSLTEKQLGLSQSKTFISNYVENIHPSFPVKFVLTNLNHSALNAEIAQELNIGYLANGVLNLEGKQIPVFSSYQGKYGNLSGYLDTFSEEDQAKKIREFLKANGTKSFLIQHFNDFKTQAPDITQTQLGDPYLNQAGLVNSERLYKKSYRMIKALLNEKQELAFNPGTQKLKEEYAFIILGVIILAFLVIGLRQALRMTDSIKRAFFHVHGLYSDTRDRRTLYMGQSLFLMFIYLLICGNILAAFVYFHRESLFLTTLTNYLFTYETAQSIQGWFNHPVYAQFMALVLMLVVFLFTGFVVKVASIFLSDRVSYKQSLTVTIWAYAPLLLLVPVSIFMYNAFLLDISVEYMMYYLAGILFWCLLRWVNGARVLTNTGHIRIYLFSIFITALLASGIWFYLEYIHNFGDYIDYFGALLN